MDKEGGVFHTIRKIKGLMLPRISPAQAGFLGFNLNRDRWDPGHEVPRIDRTCRF